MNAATPPRERRSLLLNYYSRDGVVFLTNGLIAGPTSFTDLPLVDFHALGAVTPVEAAQKFAMTLNVGLRALDIINPADAAFASMERPA